MLQEINNLIIDQNDIFSGNIYLNKSEDPDDENRKTFLVPYQINTMGKAPFLQYIFYKTDDDYITFIPGHSNDYAKNILLIEEVCRCYRLGLDQTSFKGYFRDDKYNFMFFAFPENTIECHLLYSTNDLWLLSMDEIANHFIKEFTISELVKDFFATNPSFAILSKNGQIYETPMIVYHGCNRKKASFIATFGIPPSLHYDSYPYEFKTLEKACEEHSNGALIRFAVFLGNMSFIEDLDNINHYDSIFDQNKSLIRLAEYEQIVSLSFHYLNYKSQII